MSQPAPAIRVFRYRGAMSRSSAYPVSTRKHFSRAKSLPRLELVDAANTPEVRTGRFGDLSPEKLRGGYYTPQPIAQWLARWALRSPADSFLEPSCGDGRILQAGINRLIELGADTSKISEQVQGIELIAGEAEAARVRISKDIPRKGNQVVQVGDFFAWHGEQPETRFDAVVGNPPFIRYQSFPEPSRSRAMSIMQELGLRPNKLTNIWVPFVVAATESLKAGGRLAMVIPAELLQVTYAAQLRAYLTERFEHIGIFACNELFFDQAEQEVLLLLAEGALERRTSGARCKVSLMQADTVDHLLAMDPADALAGLEEKDVKGDSEKWLKYFLSAKEIAFMRELRLHAKVAALSKYARVDVGVVTGKNEFFVLRKSEADQHALIAHTTRLVSRAAHLRGAIISEEDWTDLARSDDRVFLLDIRAPRERLRAKVRAYIAEGEALRFHEGYKCSIRDPWFQVPSIWAPDGFLFRQIHDFPRFVRNSAGATSTDTIHRFTAVGCDPDMLIANTFTHLTAASAEIEGRSYGGGVLELEPTEAERLLIPAVLGSSMPLEEADALIRQGRLSTVLEQNDETVLRGALGLSKQDCLMLKAIWAKLRDRRMARTKSRRSKAK